MYDHLYEVYTTPQALTQKDESTRIKQHRDTAQSDQDAVVCEAGGAFSGVQVGGAYGGAFHQTWELTLPDTLGLWGESTLLLTVDVVIVIAPNSWKPDYRYLDKWVWDFNFSELMKNAIPVFTNFRIVESSTYRLIAKIIGDFIPSAHKLRFGFNVKGLWQSGQGQQFVYHTSSTVSATGLNTAIRDAALDFSEESGPSNTTLTNKDDPFEDSFCLHLLFDDAENSDTSITPTEWALL